MIASYLFYQQNIIERYSLAVCFILFKIYITLLFNFVIHFYYLLEQIKKENQKLKYN